MGSRKCEKLKKKVVSAAKSNKRAPVWVVLKTKDTSIRFRNRRHWRYNKLKIKED
ncbi:MAG: 50S ribosomal protein L39e [archaeon]